MEGVPSLAEGAEDLYPTMVVEEAWEEAGPIVA